MEKIQKIIQSKPTWILLLIVSYILILGILKWRLTPDITTVFYLLGGVFGVYFMDLAEMIFDIHPSPFRTIIFTVLFGVVSFFVVTSSGSMFASGLVLALYFTLLLDQAEEWQTQSNLNRWYTMIRPVPAPSMQLWIVLVTSLLLVGEILLFIR